MSTDTQQTGGPRTMSADELTSQEFDLLPISFPWAGAIGRIELDAQGMIWGEAGAGKSTFALMWANVLAHFGSVVYVSEEESLGYTFTDKVKRIGADHENLTFQDHTPISELMEQVETDGGPDCLFIDSYNEMDATLAEFKKLRQVCDDAGVGLWFVMHARKSGETYKGDSAIGHKVDVEAFVGKDSMLRTKKNRYAPRGKSPVPFTKDELPTVPVVRENPVRLPFTVTLREIIENNGNAARSTKTLNRHVGFRYGCRVRENPDGEPVALHFEKARYGKTKTRDEVENAVTMLVDGETYDEACARTQKEAIAELKRNHGDLVVEITSQEQAKKVLGAKEYKRQEKKRKERLEEDEEPASPVEEDVEEDQDFATLRAGLTSDADVPTGDLPHKLEKVFERTPDAKEIPVDDLELDHYDEDKMERAQRHMREAFVGEGPRREPLTVLPGDNGLYEVEDGNSTLAAATLWDWPTVLAEIKERAPAGEAEPDKTDGERFDEGIASLESLLDEHIT